MHPGFEQQGKEGVHGKESLDPSKSGELGKDETAVWHRLPPLSPASLVPSLRLAGRQASRHPLVIYTIVLICVTAASLFD